jgi:hypothetical protein
MAWCGWPRTRLNKINVHLSPQECHNTRRQSPGSDMQISWRTLTSSFAALLAMQQRPVIGDASATHFAMCLSAFLMLNSMR